MKYQVMFQKMTLFLATVLWQLIGDTLQNELPLKVASSDFATGINDYIIWDKALILSRTVPGKSMLYVYKDIY